jgi:hypothetical protein
MKCARTFVPVEENFKNIGAVRRSNPTPTSVYTRVPVLINVKLITFPVV